MTLLPFQTCKHVAGSDAPELISADSGQRDEFDEGGEVIIRRLAKCRATSQLGMLVARRV